MKTEDRRLVMLKHHDMSIDVLKGTIYKKHNVNVLDQLNYRFSISSYAIIRCQKITFPTTQQGFLSTDQ